jgi:hypothetical protein
LPNSISTDSSTVNFDIGHLSIGVFGLHQFERYGENFRLQIDTFGE